MTNEIQLAALQNGVVKLTPTGLRLLPDLPYEVWEDIGVVLQKLERAVQFAIGDWINYGEAHYGEKYAQAIEVTPYKYKTLADYAYVANAVKSSVRTENLSFTHHKIVAHLRYEEQAHYLELAAHAGYTTRELSSVIRYGMLPDERASDPDPLPHAPLITCPFCGMDFEPEDSA